MSETVIEYRVTYLIPGSERWRTGRKCATLAGAEAALPRMRRRGDPDTAWRIEARTVTYDDWTVVE